MESNTQGLTPETAIAVLLQTLAERSEEIKELQMRIRQQVGASPTTQICEWATATRALEVALLASDQNLLDAKTLARPELSAAEITLSEEGQFDRVINKVLSDEVAGGISHLVESLNGALKVMREGEQKDRLLLTLSFLKNLKEQALTVGELPSKKPSTGEELLMTFQRISKLQKLLFVGFADRVESLRGKISGADFLAAERLVLRMLRILEDADEQVTRPSRLPSPR